MTNRLGPCLGCHRSTSWDRLVFYTLVARRRFQAVSLFESDTAAIISRFGWLRMHMGFIPTCTCTCTLYYAYQGSVSCRRLDVFTVIFIRRSCIKCQSLFIWNCAWTTCTHIFKSCNHDFPTLCVVFQAILPNLFNKKLFSFLWTGLHNLTNNYKICHYLINKWLGYRNWLLIMFTSSTKYEE